MLKVSTAPLVLFLVISSGNPASELVSAPVSGNYGEELQQWIDDRIETLKESANYVRLAGMLLLDEGVNLFDQLDGFKHFPTDSKWHLIADYKPKSPGSTIPISNVLCQITITS